jgi:hypothetical protein
MNKHLISFAIALCGIAGGAMAAEPAMSKNVYKAEKDKIDAQAKLDLKACGRLKANAKDICQADAKGKEEIAEAELEARYKPSPEADREAKNAKAEADYDVAKEKCDAVKGNARDVCLKRAKADREAAIRLAKVEKVESIRGMNSKAAAKERKDARNGTSDARYAADKERCDALHGDAKEKCSVDVKRKFNRT